MENMSKIKDLITNVESEAKELDKLQEEALIQYTSELDAVMDKIKAKQVEFNEDLPINILSVGIMDLCSTLYFALKGLEKMGNRSDLAEQKRLEKYNAARSSTPGTAADKASFAEANSAMEKSVADLYKRCYKDLKARIDSGIFMVEGLKKALNVKSQEIAITREQDKVM